MEGLQTGQTIMMQLGSFQFGISTAAYQELTRSTEYRWAKQDRFGQNPALQFTGPGDDTITLPGVIYPEWRGGGGQLEAMRKLAAEGLPMLLVNGRGTMLGRWCIERVEEKQSVFAAAGAPRKQEFTISLRFFGDASLADSLFAMAGAQFNTGAIPTASNALSMSGSLASGSVSAASGVIGGLTSALGSINSVVGSAMQSLAPALTAVNRGITAARSLHAAASQAQRLFRGVSSISTLGEAQYVLGGLVSGTGAALNNAMRASDTLREFGAKLTTDGEATSVLAAVNGGLLTVNRMALTVTGIRRQADGIMRVFS